LRCRSFNIADISIEVLDGLDIIVLVKGSYYIILKVHSGTFDGMLSEDKTVTRLNNYSCILTVV